MGLFYVIKYKTIIDKDNSLWLASTQKETSDLSMKVKQICFRNI